MEDTDEVLVGRAGSGNREACRLLVERHIGPIVAFATRVMGNQADGEEVAQEVFLRLWREARRWRPGKASLSTWLHRVALNLCLDRLARRREQPMEGAEEAADPAPGAAEMIEEEELGRHVNRELAKLPERQRVAITLCHYQGVGNREAAEVMGVSVDALESLLARGRRTLKRRLSRIAGDLLG